MYSLIHTLFPSPSHSHLHTPSLSISLTHTEGLPEGLLVGEAASVAHYERLLHTDCGCHSESSPLLADLIRGAVLWPLINALHSDGSLDHRSPRLEKYPLVVQDLLYRLGLVDSPSGGDCRANCSYTSKGRLMSQQVKGKGIRRVSVGV